MLPWALRAGRVMELLWLLTVFFVPLMFVSPALMENGFSLPKVTLYRSLVGLVCAIWIIEAGLTHSIPGARIPKLSPTLVREWLRAHPGRWVFVAGWLFVISNLISTLLSPSIPVSLWGREPGLDGNSFYNTISHFLLFLAVATHLERSEQVWRLLGAIAASGVVVGLYAIVQFYGFDPFGLHVGGESVVSTLGNPIFTGAYLLMTAPIILALALKSDGASGSPVWTMWWIIPLTIPVLGMAFTLARGPWAGLAVGLATMMALLGMAIGWRISFRGLVMSAAAIAITWSIVTFIPTPAGGADLAPRALSAGSAVISSLTAETPDSQAQTITPKTSTQPTSMQTRVLLWRGAAGMALNRPWFRLEEPPMPLSLHLFGYGPEFFQYVFPLIHPREIRHLNIGPVYYGVTEAHNNILNRWVELGFFGLGSYLVLLGALALIGIRVILNKGTSAQVSLKLVMAAVVAAVAGRTVEQLAGIPHISDEALFWTLVALVAALPKLMHGQIRGETSSRRVESPLGAIQVTSPIGRVRVLQVSLALVLAGLVLAFTWVRNPNYALAESMATSAAAYLVDDQPKRAMQSIDGAIELAPDVGRYRVIRANILDQARSSATTASDQARLALEAYRANRRAIAVNRFDIYGRLHFAESALTLAILGHPGKGEEAINGFQRLTFMQPRLWLAHFLLGRAYQEMGESGLAVEAYSESIRIDPLNPLLFDRRAEAYEILGKRGLALDDHDTAVVLSPNDPSYHVRRGIALFSLGRLNEAIQDFDQAINSYEESLKYLAVSQRNLDEAAKFEPRLARAYNNRGSSYYQLGRIERAIEDYDRAIQLSPRLAEFYANRAYAYELLSKDSEARRDFERATSLGFKGLSLDQK